MAEFKNRTDEEWKSYLEDRIWSISHPLYKNSSHRVGIEVMMHNLLGVHELALEAINNRLKNKEN